MQVEFDFDNELDSDWVSFVHGGFESILPHSFDGFLIETHAEMTHDVDVLRIALAVNNELNGDAALEIGGTSFRGEFGINGMNDRRRTHAAAYAHHATAKAAAASRAVAQTVTGPDAAAEA